VSESAQGAAAAELHFTRDSVKDCQTKTDFNVVMRVMKDRSCLIRDIDRDWRPSGEFRRRISTGKSDMICGGGKSTQISAAGDVVVRCKFVHDVTQTESTHHTSYASLRITTPFYDATTRWSLGFLLREMLAEH
jgi:hypothetical protein